MLVNDINGFTRHCPWGNFIPQHRGDLGVVHLSLSFGIAK